MMNDRLDVEQHLRAASDAVLLVHSEVGQLERHKRLMPPADRRFATLAASVRAAAQALAEFTEEEEAWARGAGAVSPDLMPISDADTDPALSAILERWRAVERELNAAEPGSERAGALFAEFERLRDEYMQVFRTRTRD